MHRPLCGEQFQTTPAPAAIPPGACGQPQAPAAPPHPPHNTRGPGQPVHDGRQAAPPRCDQHTTWPEPQPPCAAADGCEGAGYATGACLWGPRLAQADPTQSGHTNAYMGHAHGEYSSKRRVGQRGGQVKRCTAQAPPNGHVHLGLAAVASHWHGGHNTTSHLQQYDPQGVHITVHGGGSAICHLWGPVPAPVTIRTHTRKHTCTHAHMHTCTHHHHHLHTCTHTPPPPVEHMHTST